MAPLFSEISSRMATGDQLCESIGLVVCVVGHQNVAGTGKRSWAVKDTQISDMAFNLASEWSGVGAVDNAGNLAR